MRKPAQPSPHHQTHFFRPASPPSVAAER
ncbi:hypothetical protein ECEC1865_6358, partial [Escherichia coli EC1865]